MDQNKQSHLWNELRSGEHAALRQIYDQEFPFLFNYGKKITTDIALLEDSIQDLFIDIWNRREHLSATDSIRKYLAVSLKRKIIKHLKKGQKTSLQEDFSTHDFAAEISVESRMILDESKLERLKGLKKGFAQLPKRQQEVIYLKYYSGMKNEDIAETMNITNQSVRNLVHKAIKALSNNVSLQFLLFYMSTILI